MVLLFKKGEAGFMNCLQDLRFFDSPKSFFFLAELAKIAVIKQQRHAQMLAVLQRSPSWNITNEEKYFIQELCQLELNTSRSLPVPQNIMFMIINAARTGTAIPIEVAVQGYSICMQRVIKYASCMEFFNRYSHFFI